MVRIIFMKYVYRNRDDEKMKMFSVPENMSIAEAFEFAERKCASME
jgi:hypothetical protein